MAKRGKLIWVEEEVLKELESIKNYLYENDLFNIKKKLTANLMLKKIVKDFRRRILKKGVPKFEFKI